MHPRIRPGRLCVAIFFSLCGLASAKPGAAETPKPAAGLPTQQTVKMWSNWPEELYKRGFVEDRIKRFENITPQCKVNLEFIPKADLYTAARAGVVSGQMPDIFWLEPDEIGFAKNGHLEPLDSYIKTENLEDWARRSWTYEGKVYGLPLEAYSVELYYNRELLKQLGTELPESRQLTQAEFTALIKRAIAAKIPAVAQGAADRPYPGANLLQEALLRKLGIDDYRALLTGKLPFRDPRVREVMVWLKDLIDAGAYPKNFSTLKLAESHQYFHTSPGSLMFPMASWYTGRAFVPPKKGGQPLGFPLGLMKYPAMENGKCPECKTLAVGGSFVMYSKGKNKDCAGKLLNFFASVKSGNRWMEDVLLQTGIKTDPASIQSIYVLYFKQLLEGSTTSKFFIGTPLHYMTGKCAETFTKVLNRAFPAGTMTVDEAASQMDAACLAH